MGDGEQQLSALVTTEEEMEIHQHREQIDKLRRNTESTYYQVTQMAIDNRPRLQKLHNVSKLKVIMIMTNEEMEEILNQTNLNITELNHLTYSASTVITKEIMEQESINHKHRGQNHPCGLDA
jgi:anion-transporting  ArsA/GET3 family ATPase